MNPTRFSSMLNRGVQLIRYRLEEFMHVCAIYLGIAVLVTIAAGSVVLENSRLESGCLYAGTPAKKVKVLGEELLKGQIDRIANNYVMYSGWFKDGDGNQ